MTKSNDTYDTIFIGAGIGGLAAAAILARRGKKVLICERHTQFGGYASTFARDGAIFDVSLHQIGGVKTTGLRQVLEAAGVYAPLKFIKHTYLSELKHPDTGEIIRIPNGDMKTYQQDLITRFPTEKTAILHWFRIMRSYGRQIKISDRIQSANPVLRGLGLLTLPILTPRLVLPFLFPKTLGQHLKATDPWLRQILGHFSGYFGLPVDRLNSLFPMAAYFGYYDDGGYYLEGGGFALSRALAKIVVKNGGSVKRGAEVEEITTQAGRVTGVRLKGSGEKYHAKQVVCSAGPLPVLRDMLPGNEAAKAEYERLAQREISMSATVLYLKLNVPIGTLNPDLATAYEFVEMPRGGEAPYFDRALNNKGFDNDYSDDGLVLSIHSNVENHCKGSDKNSSVLDVFFADTYDRWDALSADQYQAQKQIEKDKILTSLERLLPGLRDHIAVAELGTPITMKKFTGNERGAIYGFAQTPDQMGAKRPAKSRAVRGLHFVSAWGNPGGGYEGALRSAWNFAQPLWHPVSIGVFAATIMALIIGANLL